VCVKDRPHGDAYWCGRWHGQRGAGMGSRGRARRRLQAEATVRAGASHGRRAGHGARAGGASRGGRRSLSDDLRADATPRLQARGGVPGHLPRDAAARRLRGRDDGGAVVLRAPAAVVVGVQRGGRRRGQGRLLRRAAGPVHRLRRPRAGRPDADLESRMRDDRNSPRPR